MSNYA